MKHTLPKLKAKEILNEYLGYCSTELTVDEKTTEKEITMFAYYCSRYYIEGMINIVADIDDSFLEYWMNVQIELILEVQLINSVK